MRTAIARFLKDERGATAIEYGLIAALFAVLVIVGMTLFGSGLTNLFGFVSGRSVAVMG